MADGRCGQFTRLTNQGETHPAVSRKRRRKDESTCLRRSDDVEVNAFNSLSKKRECGIECAMI
jgi:hypothetical protein